VITARGKPRKRKQNQNRKGVIKNEKHKQHGRKQQHKQNRKGDENNEKHKKENKQSSKNHRSFYGCTDAHDNGGIHQRFGNIRH
jgi:hypothetical protein